MQKKLLGLRKEKGVTQQNLADLIGVSKNTYSNKEQGKRDFKISEMFKIANFFQVEIGEIFSSNVHEKQGNDSEEADS